MRLPRFLRRRAPRHMLIRDGEAIPVPAINVRVDLLPTTPGGLTGSYYHAIERIEREDDGSFTAVIAA